MAIEHYLGFFLEKQAEKDEPLYQLACFQSSGDFRKVVKLRSQNGPLEVPIGTLVQLTTQAPELVDNTKCTFMEINPPLYIHDTGCVHTAKNFEVDVADCIGSGEYQHLELGRMYDVRRQMYPGSYHNMTFQVVVEGSSFRLNVLQALRKENASIANQPSTSAADDLSTKFDHMARVLGFENKWIEDKENENWEAVGPLRVIKLDNHCLLDGVRPVLELVDKGHVELFCKMSDAALVTMIKVIKNPETGEWETDLDAPERELSGCMLTIEGAKHKCIVKMISAVRHLTDKYMKVGDVFKFKSNQSTDNIAFWTKGEQVQSDVFQHTVEEGDAEECKLNDVLDSHMSDADELKTIGDKVGKSWGLNPSQTKAVLMAQNPKRKLVCIQGPPGTGKTHVLAYYLLSLLKDGKQAVVMTPTKEALSNIKKKLEEVLAFRKISVHKNALMNTWLFQERLNESDAVKRGHMEVEVWREQYEKNKLAFDDYVKLRKCMAANSKAEGEAEILEHVQIVFSTITSSFVKTIMEMGFSPEVCVIDEAAQVMEAQTWPACCKMQRIVLAGDPKQLPAIVFSQEARNFELESSVLDRIMKDKERFSWIMLDTQYRSQMAISQWSNKHFYGNSLQNASKSPVLHRHFNNTKYSQYRFFEPLVMIDTSFVTEKEERKATYENIVFATSDMNQAQTAKTYSNTAEAEIVIDYFSLLVKLGVKPENIAIITPYKGQWDLIRRMSTEKGIVIENIGTVDSYQGQEYDVVIFSMVRSNPALHLGFVSNLRRLNVAITRAKSQFCLVGNSYMLSHNKEEGKKEAIIDLFNYFHQNKLRFPPTFARGDFGHFKAEVTGNNFGYKCDAFREHTRDERMVEFIDNFNARKPAYDRNRLEADLVLKRSGSKA